MMPVTVTGSGVSVHPASEPVTTSEAKTHCRISSSDEDALIAALITAARQLVEEMSGRALFTQTRTLRLAAWPDRDLELPGAPLASVSSITYMLEDGTTSTLASTVYTSDTASEPGRIGLKPDQEWPTDDLWPLGPITVTYVAGWTSTGAIPTSIKQAILMLIGHWYENREQVVIGSGYTSITLPHAVEALLSRYRVRPPDWVLRGS